MRSFRKLLIMYGRTSNGEFLCRFISICIYPREVVKYIFIFFFLLSSFSISRPGISQSLHTSSSRAIKAYNNGLEAFDFLNLAGAESFFKEAIVADSRFFEAYMMLGELYTKQKRFGEAASNYKMALRLDSVSYKPLYFSMANAEMMSGDYASALSHYKSYLRNKACQRKTGA